MAVPSLSERSLSADATASQRESFLAAGAQGYLTKPFALPVLLERLDEALAMAPVAVPG